MKNGEIKLSLNYVTNFQPNILVNSKVKLNKTKNKIFLKNFLIFSLMMKYVCKNNSVKIFVKPKYNNVQTILRAPYKNKISRHQITISRFFINMSYKYFISEPQFFDLSSVCFFLRSCKKFFSFFETNLCYQHKSRVCFNFCILNYFNYSLFSKKL